jgi:hypothetical protein
MNSCRINFVVMNYVRGWHCYAITGNHPTEYVVDVYATCFAYFPTGSTSSMYSMPNSCVALLSDVISHYVYVIVSSSTIQFPLCRLICKLQSPFSVILLVKRDSSDSP